MLKKTLFCTALFLSLISFSQIGQKDEGQIVSGSNIGYMGSNHLPDSFLESRNKITKYEDVEGTAYIDNNLGANNNLPIGKIYDKEFTYLSTTFVRYNAYTDDMEVSLMDDGVDYYLLKKKPDYFYLVLRKKTYRAYEYLDGKKKITGFFVIVSKNDKGTCTLLKKEKIVFKKSTKADNSFVTSSGPSFNRIRDAYYLKLENGLVRIPRKRKDLIKLFESKENEMETFIKKHDLGTKREKDLLRMVDHYNSII